MIFECSIDPACWPRLPESEEGREKRRGSSGTNNKQEPGKACLTATKKCNERRYYHAARATPRTYYCSVVYLVTTAVRRFIPQNKRGAGELGSLLPNG